VTAVRPERRSVGGDSSPSGPASFAVRPRVEPPLDPGFRPITLGRRALGAAAQASGHAQPVALALEQPGGSIDVREAVVIDAGRRGAAASRALCERLVKSMLWSRGGARLWVEGPADVAAELRRHYAATATGRFDAMTIGEAVYGRPLEIVAAARRDFPISRDTGSALGGHLDGCRIGFDLGASDRKAAAVIDGRVVFSEEVAWDPAGHADPQWHLDQITDSIRRAAAHLPRVDAIGGSSAGIYVDNEVRVASIFRSVPADLFRSRVTGIFRELQAAWGGVPFVILNDGEVTALAGAMLAGVGGLLGIAMGSSEAAGYVRRDGRLTTWLNELAFAPLDLARDAPIDEWSGDRGCGVQYLSQQAVGRLLPKAGIEVDVALPLPELLVQLQRLMAAGDDRAVRVYETVGTYLGYALLEYRDLYAFEHVLLLGRVTSGAGGQLIEERAAEVLRVEDPPAAEAIAFHRVSERDKRHGQAVAAASLPALAP
jgi:predicted NBD/HSP70 family sugar kinase